MALRRDQGATSRSQYAGNCQSDGNQTHRVPDRIRWEGGGWRGRKRKATEGDFEFRCHSQPASNTTAERASKQWTAWKSKQWQAALMKLPHPERWVIPGWFCSDVIQVIVHMVAAGGFLRSCSCTCWCCWIQRIDYCLQCEGCFGVTYRTATYFIIQERDAEGLLILRLSSTVQGHIQQKTQSNTVVRSSPVGKDWLWLLLYLWINADVWIMSFAGLLFKHHFSVCMCWFSGHFFRRHPCDRRDVHCFFNTSHGLQSLELCDSSLPTALCLKASRNRNSLRKGIQVSW